MPPLLPTSPAFLRLQGERRGAAGGLVFADRFIPWGELAAAADELAGWLARRGGGARRGCVAPSCRSRHASSAAGGRARLHARVSPRSPTPRAPRAPPRASC